MEAIVSQHLVETATWVETPGFNLRKAKLQLAKRLCYPVPVISTLWGH